MTIRNRIEVVNRCRESLSVWRLQRSWKVFSGERHTAPQAQIDGFANKAIEKYSENSKMRLETREKEATIVKAELTFFFKLKNGSEYQKEAN